MIRPEEVYTWAWFVRHSYWMWAFGWMVGAVMGVGVSLGAWYAVQKLQEWRERHNYETWRKFRRAA